MLSDSFNFKLFNLCWLVLFIKSVKLFNDTYIHTYIHIQIDSKITCKNNTVIDEIPSCPSFHVQCDQIQV